MDDDLKKTIAHSIDLERLAELLGNDDESAMFDYLDMFLDAFPGLIAEIKKAINDGNATALHHAAHKAKGAANAAAASELVNVLRELESAASQQCWEDFHRQFSRLESEYKRVEEFCAERGAQDGV